MSGESSGPTEATPEPTPAGRSARRAASRFLPLAAAVSGVAAAAVTAATAPGPGEADVAIAAMTASEHDRLRDAADRFAELGPAERAELRRVAAAVAADRGLAETLARYGTYLDALPYYRRAELRREDDVDQKLALIRRIAAEPAEETPDRDDLFSRWRTFFRDDGRFETLVAAFAAILPFEDDERTRLAREEPVVRAAWVFGRLASTAETDRRSDWRGAVPPILGWLNGRREELREGLPDDRPAAGRDGRSEITLATFTLIFETERRWDEWKLAAVGDDALLDAFKGVPPAERAELIALPPAELRRRLGREAAESRLADLTIPEADRRALRRVTASSARFRDWITTGRRGRGPDGGDPRGRLGDFLRDLGNGPVDARPGGGPPDDRDRRPRRPFRDRSEPPPRPDRGR